MSEAVVIEKKVKKEKKKMEPKRKKKIIRRSIILGIVAIILALLIVPNLMAANALPIVTTVDAFEGNIEADINTSGTISSGEKKVYFSKVSSVIGALEVESGDLVTKGDTLVTYDITSLESAVKQSTLTGQAEEFGYQDTISENSQAKQELNSATTDVATLEQQIEDQKAYIKSLEESINAEMVAYRTKLEAQVADQQKALRAYTEQLTLTPNNENVRKTYNEINDEITRLNTLLSHISEFKTADNKEDLLADAKELLTEYQTNLTEAQTTKKAKESAVLSSYKLEQYETSNEANSIKISEQQSDLETAKSGIVAEFSGVVSDVAVVEGQTVTEGLQLFTLNSTENVIVKFNVSKYELETLELGQKADVIVSGNTYQGTVTKISKMATLNASGTAMIAAEVTVENPDEAIYLGIEAKITIYTEEATNAVLVPIEAVNADKDGDFCYVVVNGIVERRNVTVGISSDLLIEIKEGIKVGDKVVKSGMTDATEGSMVTAITEVTEE